MSKYPEDFVPPPIALYKPIPALGQSPIALKEPPKGLITSAQGIYAILCYARARDDPKMTNGSSQHDPQMIPK
eukprot:11853970-Karenia_brevis.AAC.1